MPKFRKKPVEIEAIQFTVDVAIECMCDGKLGPFGLSVEGHFHPVDRKVYTAHISIQTLEGAMRAILGDWIIKGVNGELYPCKPDIFEKTYEPAE